MKHSEVFKEARRLYDLGFAIHWLHPKSKRPVESGWGSGPRKSWKYLAETYIEGRNVGVRLGTPSPMPLGYLAVVDVDVKSESKEHRLEALASVKKILSGAICPEVRSGRGNGSRHYYCVSQKPFKTWNPAQSEEIIKVHMPSKKPSKHELTELSAKEIEAGIRLSHAWEISLYSDGRQVVLPPSIHPDSGKPYTWKMPIVKAIDVPLIPLPDEPSISEVRREQRSKVERSEIAVHDFKLSPVDLDWVPISDKIKEGIKDGKGVTDRSGYLLIASSALISAGLSTDEVLTVLTDPNTVVGACAYEHAQTKNRARAAQWVYKYTLRRVSSERSAEGIFTKAPEPAEKMTEAEMESFAKEVKELRHWTWSLLRSGPKGDGPPKSCVINVVTILENAVSPTIFQRNLFAYRDTYAEDTPWGGVKDAVLTDDDITKIKFWLSENWEFEPKNQVIEDAVLIMSCKNAFDPLVDMVEALPEWDGVNRLDGWLVKNFNAKGSAAYNGEIFRKWLVGMIMRIYKPGAKFDWMPIFEGPQRAGKSSFGKLLAGGEKYFLDWLPNLHDKDAALALQGMWVIEMGELASLRKNEIDVVKGFVTRTVDKLRPPFGRRSIESARRCVFFGTTNREQYLQDDTGNRRFKPLLVGTLNFKALKTERTQLFAEAKYLWDNKIETERTLDRLSTEAAAYEKTVHADKMIEDESSMMYEALSDFISDEKISENFDVEKFRIYDLFHQAVGTSAAPLHKWKSDRRGMMLAAKAVKMLGGTKRELNGRNYWKMPNSTKKAVLKAFGTATKFSEREMTF